MGSTTASETKSTSRWAGVRKYAVRGIEYLFPVAISVVLVVWLFHKVNFHDVMHVVRTECNVWYLVLMMAITTLSHISRGIRWGIQLRGAGVPSMPVLRECVSIFGAYALNLVFPRLGEAWRCVYVSKRERVPLSTVVGTEPGTCFGLIPGLVVFVFGSFSMAVPSNGGLGPWNVAVMYALSLYGISDTQGTAFSLVMWSMQAAWLVVQGIFSAAYVVWDDRHNPQPSRISDSRTVEQYGQ